MRALDQVLSRIWGFGATWRFAKLGIRVTTRDAVPVLVTRISDGLVSGASRQAHSTSQRDAHPVRLEKLAVVFDGHALKGVELPNQLPLG